jgi:hypothetical protein
MIKYECLVRETHVMFKKSPHINFFLLFFVIISCDVQAASRVGAAWNGFISFFGDSFNFCGCHNATNHVVPMNPNIHRRSYISRSGESRQPGEESTLNVTSSVVAALDKGDDKKRVEIQETLERLTIKEEESTLNVTPSVVVTRDKVDDKTRREILETLEMLKVKCAPVPVTTRAAPIKKARKGNLSISDKNTFTPIDVVTCKECELDIHDRLITQKLIITDEVAEENKGRFFLKVSEFQNLEELILENCEDLISIPADKLRALQKLRHLSLCRACMDFRYAPGYHDRGFKIENLLEILNIPSLKYFTLHVSDLTEVDKNNLRQNAQAKGITVTLLW